MRIFLIGLTGCGKTTLGKKLALQLGIEFVDLDEYITKKEKSTIADIFANKGEAYFREIEAKCVREVCKLKKVVVATGGGAACFHDNMTVMNIAGVTIFLNVETNEISKRLWNQPHREQRPMIANRSFDELQEFLKNLLSKRLEFYSEAKLIIEGNNLTVENILERLDEMD
jgi:shikimate kinase